MSLSVLVPSKKAFVIPANLSAEIAMSGEFIFVASATGTFSIQLDGGLPMDVLPGMFFPVNLFRNLIALDTSGAPNSVVLYTGPAGLSFFPPTTNTVTKDAPTYTKGTALGAMAGGAATNFTGIDAATGQTRKQIIVSNDDAALEVAVLDQNGVRIGRVYPQRPWTLATSGFVTVKNQNGGALTGVVDVGETFYV
jgi:hypothetical protein